MRWPRRAPCPRFRERVERRAEDLHPVLERLAEALLLRLQHLRHPRLVARELGIGGAHLPVEIFHELVEERLLLSELVAVADRAPDDPAQDVAAAVA